MALAAAAGPSPALPPNCPPGTHGSRAASPRNWAVSGPVRCPHPVSPTPYESGLPFTALGLVLESVAGYSDGRGSLLQTAPLPLMGPGRSQGDIHKWPRLSPRWSHALAGSLTPSGLNSNVHWRSENRAPETPLVGTRAMRAGRASLGRGGAGPASLGHGPVLGGRPCRPGDLGFPPDMLPLYRVPASPSTHH